MSFGVAARVAAPSALLHTRITLNCVHQAAFLSFQDRANVAALPEGCRAGLSGRFLSRTGGGM
jgi:hypothetical protein